MISCSANSKNETYFEVELAILDFFGEKVLYVNEELDVEGLGVNQPVMTSQLQKNDNYPLFICTILTLK